MRKDSTELDLFLETRFCHRDAGYYCVGTKQLQHQSSSGNVVASELVMWWHLSDLVDLAGTGSIPGGGSCQESRARGARTGAGDVMELRDKQTQVLICNYITHTQVHASTCWVRVKYIAHNYTHTDTCDHKIETLQLSRTGVNVTKKYQQWMDIITRRSWGKLIGALILFSWTSLYKN